MKKKLFYFGCIGQPGHYLYGANECQAHGGNAEIPGVDVNRDLLRHPDGMFAPYDTTQGKYNESIVPPVRIISWWDYTGDKRPGSNSTLIGYGYESGEEMLDDAVKIFPSVMNRQSRPVKAFPGGHMVV